VHRQQSCDFCNQGPNVEAGRENYEGRLLGAVYEVLRKHPCPARVPCDVLPVISSNISNVTGGQNLLTWYGFWILLPFLHEHPWLESHHGWTHCGQLIISGKYVMRNLVGAPRIVRTIRCHS